MEKINMSKYYFLFESEFQYFYYINSVNGALSTKTILYVFSIHNLSKNWKMFKAAAQFQYNRVVIAKSSY